MTNDRENPTRDNQETSGSKSRSPVKIAIQFAFFAVGLGLFAWAISLASENRAQLEEKLSEAGAGGIAILIALSVATIVLNGLMFLSTLRPVMRINTIGVIAVNACATLLSLLPFKLSLLFRTVVHNRRDGVPLFTIGSWLGVMSVLMLAFFGPVTIISSWRQDIDALWIVLTPLATIAAFVLCGWVASLLCGEVGLKRFIRGVDFLRINAFSKFVRTSTYAKMHAGIVMLADTRALVEVFCLRIADLIVLTARFWVSAEILGIELGIEGSLLLSCIYFLSGAISPAGQLGSREAAVIGAAAALGMEDPKQFAPLALLVTGTELLAMIGMAAIGILTLNPTKILQRRADAADDDEVARNVMGAASDEPASDSPSESDEESFRDQVSEIEAQSPKDLPSDDEDRARAPEPDDRRD